MRATGLILVLLSLAIGGLAGAELEQITTTDGRRFIGYYDGTTGTMTIEGPPKAVFKLSGSMIADRSPYIRPIETDPIKRDEAALVQLEAEHAAAIADATRLRKFANSRSGKDAEVAVAQANERVEQAEKVAEKIDAIKARLSAAKPQAPAEPVRVAPAKTTEQRAKEELDAATIEAGRLRDQATDLEYAATVKWLEAKDLSEVPSPKLGADPRQSEIDAENLAYAQNRQREALREFIEDAKRVRTAEQKSTFLNRLRSEIDRQAEGSANYQRRKSRTAK